MRLESFKKINIFSSGFTFLELMIVISIVAIIGASGVGFYFNYSKTVELNSMTSTIISDLKQSQVKAMSGVGGFKWGVRFTNSASSDYYEIFSTPTTYSDGSRITIATNYLPNSVTFSNPTSGNSSDIIFEKITGGTTNSSITINSSNVSKTITISSIGNISVN